MEDLKALNYCLQSAKRAFEQETERQRITVNKAEYLFKYLTLLATAFNIAVSVISKMNNIDTAEFTFRGLYFLMLAAGMAGILSTLMIQRPRKIKQFSLGTEELKKVQNEPAKYSTECKLIYQEILWNDTITKRMRQNNDKTLKWIIVAYVGLGVMIVSFGMFITYIVCIA